MSLSDKINIFLAVSSLLIAVISILVSIFILRQNSKMIENASRPYIVVYSGIVNCQSPQCILVLKNFGNSSAVIESLKISSSISSYLVFPNKLPFAGIEGLSFAPSQAMRCSLKYPEPGSDINPIEISIKYTAGKKHYFETFTINPVAENSNCITRGSTENKELRNISYALQDITEKLL